MSEFKFQQLMIAEDGSITIEEKKFVNLHNEIIHCGRMTCEFAIQMASKLKEMRDGKLFSIAGFQTFGEYVEQAVGLKERQAYNYIKVYEDLPKDFLQSNAKIGVTKLTLLASISSPERTEIIKDIDVKIEDISVRDLKEKIKELESKNAQLQLDLDYSKTTESELQSNAKKIELENIKKLDKLKKEKDKLNQEIETLKKSPKEIETIYEKDPEIVKMLEEKSKELKQKEKELKEKLEEIEILNKKLLTSDSSMTIFKLKFEDFQKSINELIMSLAKVPLEKKENCKKAIKTVLDGVGIC